MSPMTDMVYDNIADGRELSARLDRLARWGFITRKQAATLAATLTPELPGLLSIAYRVKQGALHVRMMDDKRTLAFRLAPNASYLPACEP